MQHWLPSIDRMRLECELDKLAVTVKRRSGFPKYLGSSTTSGNTEKLLCQKVGTFAAKNCLVTKQGKLVYLVFWLKFFIIDCDGVLGVFGIYSKQSLSRSLWNKVHQRCYWRFSDKCERCAFPGNLGFSCSQETHHHPNLSEAKSGVCESHLEGSLS